MLGVTAAEHHPRHNAAGAPARKPRASRVQDPRPSRTRDRLVDAAGALFHERGYDNATIDDIGSAVGLTGPALYRHFPSKEQLLVVVIEREFDRFEQRVAAVAGEDLQPIEALHRWVQLAVDTVIEDRDVITALPDLLRYLPGEVARSLVDRHRRVVDRWAHILQLVRPELSPEEARMVTIGVSALINSVGFKDHGIPPDQLRPRVERMALAAFLAG